MANCCLTRDILSGTGCDVESTGGLDKIFLFNKDDFTVTTDSCGAVTDLIPCSDYKCIYKFEPADETANTSYEITETNGKYMVSMILNANVIIASCDEQAAIAEMMGAKLVVVVLDNAGNYRIGGHVGRGFKLKTGSGDTGKLVTDESVDTIELQTTEPGKRGGWKFLLPGTDVQTKAERLALAKELIDGLVCSSSGDEDCGCEGN